MLLELYERLRDPLDAANQERRETLLDDASAGDAARETAVVLLTTTLMLVLRSYFASASGFERMLDGWSESLPATPLAGLSLWIDDDDNWELFHLSIWTLGQVTAFLLVPAIIVKLVLRGRLADYGLKLRGMFHSWWIYAAMFLVMVPLIALMSRTESFQHTYPFYRLRPGEQLWPRFLVWELLYAMQFIALEFFFRGFLLHGARRQFGAYSIMVMTVPYCMIHFGKPLPETLASIPAGFILGYMSLRTRSIWMGAALHIAVAWTMDAAALSQR